MNLFITTYNRQIAPLCFLHKKKGVAELNGFAFIEGPKVKKDQNEHK